MKCSIRCLDSDTVRRRCKALLCGLALFAAFFALYVSSSTALSRTAAFRFDDILFELDTPRVVGDMTMPQASHYRTKVHPLYILLANPWGSMAAKRIASKGDATAAPVRIIMPDGKKKLIAPEVDAAVRLNSLLGAAGVALAFVFFWLYTKRLSDAALFAFLFGLSASQLVLSTVPDTASLAICSLLVTYILFLRAIQSGRTRLLLWIPAGVFSLGVTTTNLAQTVICFAVADFAARRQRGFRHLAIRLLGLVGGVLAIAAALAWLQRAIYPTSDLFFLPEAYREEMDYASLLVLRSPLPVVVQLFKNFSWINFIAPHPTTYSISWHSLPALTFRSSLDFTPAGIIGSVLWFGLWIALGIGALRRPRTEPAAPSTSRPLVCGLLLCVLFNLMLHSIYGVGEKGAIEYFLYTGNFTFLVLTLWAIPLARPKWSFRVPLLALAVCMAINNLHVFNGIKTLFAGL